jgi:hypothetical protein
MSLMALNFLIALATALGSAIMILVILYIALKLISPESFRQTVSPARQISVQASQAIIDSATLSALSVEQIVSFLNDQKQCAALLVVNAAIGGSAESEIRKKTTMEEVLSPRGQSSPIAKRSSGQGVPNAAFCGLAS